MDRAVAEGDERLDRRPAAAGPQDGDAVTDFRRGLGFERADLEPGSTLVWIWDYLSLAALLGWVGEVEAYSVDGLRVTPWPFRSPSLVVRCEARRLHERFAEEGGMHAALAEAPPETLELELTG